MCCNVVFVRNNVYCEVYYAKTNKSPLKVMDDLLLKN